MEQDIGEKKNLAVKLSKKATELRALLDQQIAMGRSTPGPKQKNDAKIVVDKWKK